MWEEQSENRKKEKKCFWREFFTFVQDANAEGFPGIPVSEVPMPLRVKLFNTVLECWCVSSSSDSRELGAHRNDPRSLLFNVVLAHKKDFTSPLHRLPPVFRRIPWLPYDCPLRFTQNLPTRITTVVKCWRQYAAHAACG